MRKLQVKASTLPNLGFFFNSNVADILKEGIANILNVFDGLDIGRYLGMPSLVGRKKKAIFSFLRKKMWKRVQGIRMAEKVFL